MDGPGDYDNLNEVSQRQMSYAITYMRNLKKMIQMNFLQDRSRLTDIENKPKMVTKGERWRGGINWESGIDMYTLLYLKQITNKDLL